MKIEMQITREGELEQIKNLPIYRVALGDEFCPYRFPEKAEALSIIRKCEERGVEWSIMTPFMSNRSIEFFWDILDDVTGKYKEINIVVNDYGFLENLPVKYPNVKFNVCIGRMLAHSYEESPWEDIELAEENPFFRYNWTLNSFYNRNVLEHFKKKYNMTEIRLNCLPKTIKSSELFAEYGLNIVFSDKYHTVSISRNCHTARFNKIPASRECNSLCGHFYKIEHKKLYRLTPEGGKYIDNDTGMDIMDFYVAGNVVYKGYTKDYVLPVHDKTIVTIDPRFYGSTGEIAKRVEELQKVGVAI